MRNRGTDTRYNRLFATRLGLLIVVFASCGIITYSAAEPQYKAGITISYANGTSESYTILVDMNQKHAISQRYMWADSALGRLSLSSYSIDNGPAIPITRHRDGNFTLDVLADSDHKITFFARQQFEIAHTEKNMTFLPPSPTGDNWFDKDSDVRFIVPYAIPSGNDARRQLAGWSLDNSDINIIPRLESGSFESPAIHMSENHEASPYYKDQYHVSVISNFGQAFGTGWYDSGAIADISVTPADDVILKHEFAGWQGQVIGDARQYSANIVVDSPKVFVANWFVDYTNLSILSIIVIAVVVLVAIYQKRKMSAKT